MANVAHDPGAGDLDGVGLEDAEPMTDWIDRTSKADMAKIIRRLKDEAAERRRSFNLRWDADMRAIKRWQQATGKYASWPDHADLCVWLLEQMDSLQAAQESGELARLERGIAEEGARVTIESSSIMEDDWFDIQYCQDEDEVMVAIRYLELRGLLERHPERPELVRVREEQNDGL